MRIRFLSWGGGGLVRRNSEYGGCRSRFTTRGLICIKMKIVLEKGALRQLSDASCGPRETDGSVTFRGWISDYKVKNIMN